MVKVKICGITSRRDAWAALDAGADALGFVLHPASPRVVSPAAARAIIRTLPPLVVPVGVLVNRSVREIRALSAGCGFTLAQLHGDEPPALAHQAGVPVMKAFRVRGAADVAQARRYDVALYLFDSFSPVSQGGTGISFPWKLLKGMRLRKPFLLAGGLTPGNVRSAVALVRPFGVDVSGGVERAPGQKDPVRMKRFVREAKGA